ncbi:MAG: cobalamin biosynthesis protein [Anaerolineales bacterium]
MTFPYRFLVFPLALLFDIILGDPPNRFHPTAWMGSLIRWLMRFRPRGNWLIEFMFGFFIILIGFALTTGIGLVITLLANRLPVWIGILLQAFALKLTLSLCGLDRAAKDVQFALETGNLSEARRLLAWHLVSRDTSQLNESQVAAAAVESVAENASDGIVAPLFFYVMGGLPAALAYRFINTADSMLGYRDAEREWLGKFPARFDDVLNFIPARLTGLFIMLSALICGANPGQVWRIMRRDARGTASPNAGVPMSAMAGALNTELEKVGHYILGKGLHSPSVIDLVRARRLLYCSVGLAALVFMSWSLYVYSR